MVLSFNHNPYHRLGSRGPNEEATLVAEFLFDLFHRLDDLGEILQWFSLLNPHVDQVLRIAFHDRGQLGKGLVLSEHYLQELQGGEDAISSGVVVKKNNMARLFTT